MCEIVDSSEDIATKNEHHSAKLAVCIGPVMSDDQDQVAAILASTGENQKITVL